MAYVFKFGKYSGQSIEDVPQDYLDWLLKTDQEQISMIEAELTRRKSLEEASMPLVERLIHAGYRVLSMKAHPDAGGTHAEFIALQAAYNHAKELLKAAKEVGVPDDGKPPW